VWLGYEHSQWNGVPVDLARQQTGSFVFIPEDPLEPPFIAPGRQATSGTRDSITFSGFKIGVGFLF
jgi:hypothetical protein